MGLVRRHPFWVLALILLVFLVFFGLLGYGSAGSRVSDTDSAQSRLHVVKSSAVERRQILTWKFEDGPENASEEGDPTDVGPAWIDTFEGDRHVSEEKVRDGEWITRAEARRIASENGYEFAPDD